MRPADTASKSGMAKNAKGIKRLEYIVLSAGAFIVIDLMLLSLPAHNAANSNRISTRLSSFRKS
jgi:hypothetical protein